MLIGDQAKGLNFLNSKDQTGTINLKMNNRDITFEVLKVNRELSLKNNNKNQLNFQFTIHVEAGIAEQYGSLDVMTEEHYKELKKALEKEITRITTQTVSLLQKDVQTDLLGLNTHLYNYHYPLWSKVKDDWETGQHYFLKSNVTTDVIVTIVKPGNIIKSN